jgi:hypothetical protein
MGEPVSEAYLPRLQGKPQGILVIPGCPSIANDRNFRSFAPKVRRISRSDQQGNFCGGPGKRL